MQSSQTWSPGSYCCSPDSILVSTRVLIPPLLKNPLCPPPHPRSSSDQNSKSSHNPKGPAGSAHHLSALTSSSSPPSLPPSSKSHWPPSCSLNTPGMFLPQGLCTYCFLGCSSLRPHTLRAPPSPSLGFVTFSATPPLTTALKITILVTPCPPQAPQPLGNAVSPAARTVPGT